MLLSVIARCVLHINITDGDDCMKNRLKSEIKEVLHLYHCLVVLYYFAFSSSLDETANKKAPFAYLSFY